MKKLTLLLSLLCLCLFAQAQSAYQEIREGNELFKSNSFAEATKKYQESLAKDVEPVESSYNIGNALYRQEKYKDAARYFNQAANKTDDKLVKSNAYHNQGNSLLKEKKFEESVKAYKSALRNNPQNEESRYNLAYAQKMLQQQQEQEQQKKEEQKDEENKKNQENKDQQENKDEEKKNEEEKDEEPKSDEEKEQEQQEEQQKKQQQQQEQQVSREDAERILEALNQKEKELQEKLKKKKIKGVKVDIEKDW